MEAPPLFSFGLIADAQYADLDIGDLEGRLQRFREVPDKLRAAVADLKSQQPPLSCVVHLGDIINGNTTEELNMSDLELVTGIFAGLGDLPTHHTLGNHCLSVPREVVRQKVGIPDPACYYSVPLPGSWRLIVLDTTEMSGHSGYPEDSEARREARAYVAAHPMSDADPQMSPWNGGVTQRQMSWLLEQLRAAEVAGESVMVISHHQILPGAARPTHCAWNFRELQAALLGSPAFKVAFAGHDHEGGYAAADGRHFVTVEAMVEAPQGSNAYAVVHVHPNRLVIEGRGSVTSRTLELA